MRLVNQSGLSIGWCVSRVPPHKLSLTCIVKGTFTLKPGEVVTPLEPQPSLLGDVHESDDLEKALLAAGDFAHFKPACDVMLSGTCYARGGKAAPLERVTFSVGKFEKSLMVVGDRNWQPGLMGAKMTEPAPFKQMPLSYERAYGGAGYALNPFGRGYAPVEKDVVAGKHPLPNVENPSQQISSPSSRPMPAGFGPLPAPWAARTSKAGTYDKKWLKQNWPFFPDDFDWSYFNYAPQDQQLKEFLNGDETIRMRQMHATIADYQAKLPGLRPRWVMREQIGNELQFREVLLRLDTLFVDMDKELVTLVWRGIGPLASKRMREVRDILVACEPLNKPPAPAETFHAILRAEKPPEVSTAKPGPRAKEVDSERATVIAARVAKLTDLAAKLPQQAKLSPKLQEQLEFLAANLKPHTEAVPEGDWTRESVQSAIKDGFDLMGANLAGLDLSGLKLTGARMAGAVLTYCNLAKTDLSGAKLSAAILADANLAGANLSGARLPNADLVHANLAGTDVSKCDLSGADLSYANATGAKFEGANASDALFSDGEFAGANFKGAELANAEFSGARVSKADFAGANLASAAFELADAAGANFAGANCAKLKAGRGANFSGAKFAGAKLAGCTFHESRLDNADFQNADLTRGLFDGASLAGANLAGVNAPESRFDYATLQGASVAKAQLLKASFEGANLVNTDFRGANLFEAEFLDAQGSSAKCFEGANVKRSKLA